MKDETSNISNRKIDKILPKNVVKHDITRVGISHHRVFSQWVFFCFHVLCFINKRVLIVSLSTNPKKEPLLLSTNSLKIGIIGKVAPL